MVLRQFPLAPLNETLYSMYGHTVDSCRSMHCIEHTMQSLDRLKLCHSRLAHVLEKGFILILYIF